MCFQSESCAVLCIKVLLSIDAERSQLFTVDMDAYTNQFHLTSNLFSGTQGGISRMLFNSLLGFVLKPESSSFVCEPSFSDHFLLKDCGDEGEFLGFAKAIR